MVVFYIPRDIVESAEHHCPMSLGLIVARMVSELEVVTQTDRGNQTNLAESVALYPRNFDGFDLELYRSRTSDLYSLKSPQWAPISSLMNLVNAARYLGSHRTLTFLPSR
jgi:hypothetical protein